MFHCCLRASSNDISIRVHLWKPEIRPHDTQHFNLNELFFLQFNIRNIKDATSLNWCNTFWHPIQVQCHNLVVPASLSEWCLLRINSNILCVGTCCLFYKSWNKGEIKLSNQWRVQDFSRCKGDGEPKSDWPLSRKFVCKKLKNRFGAIIFIYHQIHWD